MNLKHFTYISLTGAVIISILYLKPPQPLPVVHPSEMPSPTEIIQFKKDKKEFKKHRKEQIEQGLISPKNRIIPRSYLTGRNVPGVWYERGSNNQAGRIRVAEVDLNNDNIFDIFDVLLLSEIIIG